MAQKPKYQYSHNGEMLTAKELVLLKHPSLTGNALNCMQTRFRNYVKTHGVEVAIAMIAKAKLPVSRSEYLESVQPEVNHDMLDADMSGEDLELTRRATYWLNAGMSIDEMMIKVRN